MNRKKSLGVMLNGGAFDEAVLALMRKYLCKTYRSQKKQLGRNPTREELGKILEMDRWRVTRLINGLGIINLLD